MLIMQHSGAALRATAEGGGFVMPLFRVMAAGFSIVRLILRSKRFQWFGTAASRPTIAFCAGA